MENVEHSGNYDNVRSASECYIKESGGIMVILQVVM